MNSRSLLAVLALAGFALAGDLNVIVGFKGDVDASVVRKHGKPGRVIASLDAVSAVVPSSVNTVASGKNVPCSSSRPVPP